MRVDKMLCCEKRIGPTSISFGEANRVTDWPNTVGTINPATDFIFSE